MLFQYQSKYGLELNYDFVCPHCGMKMKNNGKVVDRNAIMKCPHCGCHYYFIGQKVNFSKRQRELREQREKENLIIEERVSKRVLEINRDAESRIASAKMVMDRLVDKTRKEAEGKIAEIRLNEQGEYKRKVLDRIPFYLRWILKRYL